MGCTEGCSAVSSFLGIAVRSSPSLMAGISKRCPFGWGKQAAAANPGCVCSLWSMDCFP